MPRASAVHVSRLRGRKFGRLLTREFPLRRALGDVSFVYERLGPRVRMPAITHRRTTELVFCAKGEMTAVLGRRRLRVRAGTILLIPPGVSHRFSTGARPCEAVSLFSPALSVGPGADIVSKP